MTTTQTQAYTSLVKTLHKTLSRGRQKAEQATIRSFWETGLALDRYVLKYQKRATRDSRLFMKLAKDLRTPRYKLYSMLEFSRAFPYFVTSRNITWSHYLALLTVNDAGLRNRLLQKTIENRWSVRQLRRQIQSAREPEKLEKILACLIPKTGNPSERRIVERRGGRYYDLGFRVYHRTTRRVCRGTACRAPTFTYHAFVNEVIDADTIWVSIDLGFENETEQKLRLRGIDAPELNTLAGQKAKRFLESLLPEPGSGKSILITTTKVDKYDRYLADVFYNGVYINQALLDNGHATIA